MAAPELRSGFAGRLARCVTVVVVAAFLVCANACDRGMDFPKSGLKLTQTEITHNGKPVDAAGLAALGWRIDPEKGEAHYDTPALGSVNVYWDVPGPTFKGSNTYDISGDVTSNPGSSLAMRAEMGTDLTEIDIAADFGGV